MKNIGMTSIAERAAKRTRISLLLMMIVACGCEQDQGPRSPGEEMHPMSSSESGGRVEGMESNEPARLFFAKSKGDSSCFSIPRDLIPVQIDDGFSFTYENVDFLTGVSSDAGRIGQSSLSSVVAVSRKSSDAELKNSLELISKLGVHVMEDEAYYRIVPERLGPSSSIYFIDKKSLLTVRLLTNKFEGQQEEEALHELGLIRNYLNRAERRAPMCTSQ